MTLSWPFVMEKLRLGLCLRQGCGLKAKVGLCLTARL